MPWLNNSIALAVALIGVMVVLACTEICYIEHGNGADMDRETDDSSDFTRQVDFHFGRGFYETPPACVMGLPIHLKGIHQKTASIVEDAVNRHAMARFDKTITARHVNYISRKRAFDPTHKGDLKRLGRSLRCEAQLEIKTVGLEDFYAVIWTDLSVVIQLTLVRRRDGAILWRGKHKARRADGGLPISLFGAGAGTFLAGKLASDPDVLPSMVDDAVRRVMVSLPDIRRF
jgi:hypothetical protein